ncbi:MAG TPA: hypothetical protein VL307_14270 [Chitinophagaceae bacterium]|jgi:hypothetical protein|nr:hypothetical protein [Chitinophagaceae bacterium]
MKRNISLIVLTFEIAAIVVLHAVKMSQAAGKGHEATTISTPNIITLTKSKADAPVVKRYQLLSIK